ncbi:MAG: hypothetical protein CMO01_07140 [Thalassobius sp.]|nr:hypothetical protein [Thalassovita sp.]
MKKLLLASLISLCTGFKVYAQSEANLWYFGKHAGIKFTADSLHILNESALNTEEGCASISDKDGNLLFYTNGVSVWNREHKVMPNGNALMGHPSSTQSGVIIPKPGGNNTIYYVFTIAQQGRENGFRYSIVDMALSGGLGDVTIKNYLLSTPVTEKITAVKHRDNQSIWVLSHEWQNDRFVAYKIDKEGVAKTPVESVIGSIHTGSTTNTQGYMKASPDGTQIALALENEHLTEIFDFDNETGKLSNCIKLRLKKDSYNYGIEFSSDGSLLYVSAAGTGEVYQYNLQAGSEEKIMASAVKVGNTPDKTWIGALQIAPDGKIYFPIYNKHYLGAIEFPDSVGLACNYQNDAVFLEKGVAQLGLPTFTQSLFKKEINSELKYFESVADVEENQTLILKNVLFDTGNANLKSESFEELEKIVTLLKKNPQYKMVIAGHTDNIGNKSFNISLSERRARSVKNYLVRNHIETTRLATEGFGSSLPVRSNDTEEGRSKNRRVTFKVVRDLD